MADVDRHAVGEGPGEPPTWGQVYPLSNYHSPGTPKWFLAALHEIVPAACQPIIVAEAGFRGPWFKAVGAVDWDWVGRIRNGIKI